MQAVRESYADIGLMRERGLSWAEISDLLAKLGITARDSQPISPVTLRSAFFLVGNEGRGEAAGDDGAAAAAMPAETLAAVHEAALSAGLKGEDEESAEAAETAEAADSDHADEAAASVDAAPVQEPDEEPEDEPASADSASEPSSEPPAPAPSLFAPAAEAEDQPAAESGAPEPEAASENEAEEAPAPEPIPEPVSEPIPEPIPEPAPRPAPQPTSTAAAQNTGTLMSPPMLQDDSTNVHWKGDRMLGTIFVLNDRGGVGKTLLSHHLMATAMLEGLQLKVVEYEVNERLARLFGPDVVEHRRITQDFMNMMGSGDGFYEFWDLIGPELQRGGRLYDFGGNISQWFFNWAEVSGFDYYVGDGERLTFMVPVTVDLASLSTGMTTLERVATIAPKAKRVLVENGFSGPFSQLEDSQYARRKAEMVEREGLQVISMSPCAAPAWARLTGHRLDQVATMTREDLVKLGMTPPVASRSLIIIHEWLRNMRLALSPYLHDAFRQTPATAKAR